MTYHSSLPAGKLRAALEVVLSGALLTRHRVSRTKDPATCSCSCGGIDAEWHRYWECTKHVASHNGVRSLIPRLPSITQLTGVMPLGCSLTLAEVAKIQKHMLDVVIATSEAHLVVDLGEQFDHALQSQVLDSDSHSHDPSDLTGDPLAADASDDVTRPHQSGNTRYHDMCKLAGLGAIQPLPPLSQDAVDSLQEDPPPYPHIVRGVRRLHGDNHYIRRLLKCKICGFVASEAHQQGFYAKHADCHSVSSSRDRLFLLILRSES